MASEAAEELDWAQQDQDRPQDEQECCCEELATASKEFAGCWATHEAARAKLCSAFSEVSNRRATHEAICVEVRRAWQKTYELERKGTEAQDNMISHRDRTRRITTVHARAEALVNNSLGTLGHAVRDVAAATHSDMWSGRS